MEGELKLDKTHKAGFKVNFNELKYKGWV